MRIKKSSTDKSLSLWVLPLFFVIMSSYGISANADASSYPFKQDQPDTGSSIRHVIGTSSFPLDRRFQDLKTNERIDFLKDFPFLLPMDTPAYPVDSLKPLIVGLSKLRKDLVLANNGISPISRIGVSILVNVGLDGKAQSTSVISSTNNNLNALISSELSKISYVPGMCSGQPCVSDFKISVTVQQLSS